MGYRSIFILGERSYRGILHGTLKEGDRLNSYFAKQEKFKPLSPFWLLFQPNIYVEGQKIVLKGLTEEIFQLLLSVLSTREFICASGHKSSENLIKYCSERTDRLNSRSRTTNLFESASQTKYSLLYWFYSIWECVQEKLSRRNVPISKNTLFRSIKMQCS